MIDVLSRVQTSPRIQAALSYVQMQRWPVFPIAVAGKRPLSPRGFYNATTDMEQILRWWRQWPDANIGIPTGERTGLAVLDVDPRHGGIHSLEQLQRQHGRLPVTRTAQTGGGGLHYWYAYPQGGDRTIKNATNLGGLSGIDLRGIGGYIVAPPSQHESGRGYFWLREEPLAPFPAFLIDLACPSARYATYPIRSPSSFDARRKRERQLARKDGNYWLQQALGKAVPGTRNTTGFWLACQLRDNGIGFDEASSLMQRYAMQVGHRGSEPYTDQEALRSLSSAYCAPPREPARRTATRNTLAYR
jgi:Bifunctional DNA primase/polymerase, N-terminal